MFASTASISLLKKRAQLLQHLRAFFYARNVLEVDVPSLGAFTVTDPNLDAISCQVGSNIRYLQTSPEFFMKRLLAMGSGDIFYLGKAYRQDEQGRRHRPEFTLLEWYREGFTDEDLIAETLALLSELSPGTPIQRIDYGALFSECTGLNPHRACAEELETFARARLQVDFSNEPVHFWLDLIFSYLVEPNLADGLVVVEDYPLCQAALARVMPNRRGDKVAKRFEIFWDRLELANGYWELTDACEQARRFAADNLSRQTQHKPLIEPDNRLLAALAEGIPDCAGIALGVDRLLMRLSGCDDIAQVMPFADA
ncbi:MAG TPA: EF-P lysine aminoacylase EpmA [Cellvibrionaceae bacterium]|nr:EF-P lysine aminoacylase EpmA [Cellvibrionaceae bacterium]HMW71579.1 EF-P lysine aminoacylase EpmA [Cellvibrionaceae bacterium]HNG58779.1 EF-P lysine aminoacylase EpmA [Cellvibrionaceae bacterium]